MIPLLLGSNIFILIFNIILAVLIILVILLFILNSKDKSKISHYDIYISILKIVLPLISFTFFGQILGLLISIFICDIDNKFSIIDSSLECYAGTWFYIEAILSIICICFLICISYLTILILYKPNFINEENDILKKSSSIPDLILFIIKIIFSILFNLIKNNESYQWLILFILFIISFINVVALYHYNNYENKILMKLNKILSIILLWSIICLIIGKLFEAWNFDGTFHLFGFGIIIIILFFFYHKEKINDFYIIDFKQINTSKGRLNYIKNLLNLIKHKDKYRKDFIVFNTLILLREENCINKNCKLKKYIKMVEKGYQSDFVLYEYCQHLFEMSIKKFPDDIILKSNYIIYLTVQMSKKKLAQKVLATMQEKMFHFHNNYIIFYCKKYLEEYTPGIKKSFDENNKNIMRTTEYEKLYIKFKKNLLNASSLYYEFWSSLYKYHLQGAEDFIKLNEIGEKLNLLIDTINEDFEKLHNIKGDDLRVINLYSGFLKNILNDKRKYNNLNKILNSFSNVDKIKDKEIDFSNFDLKSLNYSDEYKYIIVSAEEENLGIILNISLNACQVFGYNKNEVIGKKATLLFPEIYHNVYEQFLIQYTNKIKSNFYDLLSNKKDYYPEFLEIIIDGKNKSKYLLTLYLKVFFAQTEESEHVYIVEFLNADNVIINKINEYFNLNNLYSFNSEEIKIFNYCCVLTDCFFNIQTFTANCQELLGLNSKGFNSNIDITNFIEQFKEDVDKMVYDENLDNNYSKNEKSELNLLNYSENYRSNHNSSYKTNAKSNNISTNKKILFKRYIAENKYSKLKLIKWKIYDLIEILMVNQNNNTKISETYRSLKEKKNHSQNENLFNKRNIFYGNEKERQFLLVIKKAKIFGKHVGYKFFFKREKEKSIDNEEEIKLKNNLEFKLKKNLKKKNNVSFKSLFINENNNEKNNEGIILNSFTEKKKIMKISKSLKNKKKENDEIENIENTIDDTKSIKSSQNEEIYPIERVGSTPLKKNILKKKPSRYASLNDMYSEKNSSNKLLIIDQNFIPNSDFSFILDIDSLSFRPLFEKNKYEKSMLNLLKNEAMAKIKQFQLIKKNLKKPKITFSSYSSSSLEDSESYEEENSSSLYLNSSNSSEKKQNTKATLKKKNEKSNEKQNQNENNINEDLEGNYYRVNGLNKIKFMIYDFEQEMVINKGITKDMKSEVENLIINYKLKIPTGLDKDINDPSLKIKKILSSFSNNELKKEKEKTANNNNNSNVSNASITNIGLNNHNINYKEQEIYNRIENALNKNDKENLIIKFLILMLLTTAILLAIAGFLLYFILNNLDNIKNNILLIVYSTHLRHYTNMAIYYTREIVVLNLNKNQSYNIYNNFPFRENRTEYLNNITNNLKEIFFEGHKNMESMMGMNLNLRENNSIFLNKKPFKTEILYDDNNIRYITSTLYVSLVQIYSFLYHFIISDELHSQNQEIFNFMHNAINNISIGIEDIIKVYLDEIQKRKDHYKINFFLLLIIIFLFYVVIYFLIKISYIQIINRKESYFSVFYDISLSFIKESMVKCEKFINKTNPNELLIAQEKNDNIDESLSFSNFNDDFIFINKSNKKSNNKNNKLNNQLLEKKTYKKISKTRIFNVKFIGILLLLYIYIFVITLKFISFINDSEIIGLYIYNMQNYHNNVLNLFNAYREFIFDNETHMHNMPILEYLGEAEKEFYATFTSDLSYISDNCYKVNKLCDIYTDIQKSQSDKNIEKSGQYMEIITSLGFFSLVSFWVEEIRIKKHYVLMLEEDKNASNNDNITYFTNRKIYLFNRQEIHPDINYIFISVILPYIDEERYSSIDRIIIEINSKHLFYIIILVIYFLIIIIIYILFWMPIINNIKYLIYKTKNMLRIIPVEILEAQTNIKSLLGVSDLND